MTRVPDALGDHLRQAGALFRSPALRGVYERARNRHETSQRSESIVHGHEAWPHLPTARDGVDQGDFLVGMTPAGTAVRWSTRKPAGLMLVLGPPGSGKTAFLHRYANALDRAGLWSFVVDAKNHAGHPLPIPQPLLTPSEAALNISAPPGMTVSAWLHAQVTLLEATCYLHSGSSYLIETALRLHSDTSDACWAAVAHDLERQIGAKHFSRTTGYKESAVSALRRLLGGHSLFSAATRMLSWERRLLHSHGLYCAGLPAEAARLAVLLIANAYVAWKRSLRSEDRATAGVLLLDDARVLVKAIERTGHAAIEPLLQLLDAGQSAGLSLCACVQSTTELGTSLLTAADAILLVGPQDGQDLHTLQPRLKLSSDQVEWLRHQLPFHGVVHSRSGSFSHPFPVVMAGPELLPPLSEALAVQAQRKQALLAGVEVKLWESPPTDTSVSPSAVPSSPPPDASSIPASALSPKAHALLLSALHHPHLIQAEHGTDCGVVGRELTDIRDDLQGRGFLNTHRLSRFALWEPTPKGAAFVGMSSIPLAGVGSFPHRFLQERLRQWLARNHPRVVVEYSEGEGACRYDVYAESARERMAWEIVLDATTLDRAVEKLGTFAGHGTIVVMDTKALVRVEKTIRASLFVGRLAAETVADLVTRTR